MLVDFKVEKDEYGYYIVAYRLRGTTELQFNTNKTLGILLSLTGKDIQDYISIKYNSEKQPKNNRMHFANFEDAQECVEGFRELIPKAIATNNLFIAD